MSNVNEPEGALQLAASMVRDQLGIANQTRTHMRQMAELLGRTLALVDLLDETADHEVVLIGPAGDGTWSVADHVACMRQMLLSMQELDAAVGDQLGGSQMLYDRFLQRYAIDDEEDSEADFLGGY